MASKQPIRFDARLSRRCRLYVPATLRGHDWTSRRVMVIDCSRQGFSVSRCDALSPVGSVISLELPNVAPGEFDLPHGIDVDAVGRVYVADRSNARVQVFDGAGKFLAQWRSAEIGRPYRLLFEEIVQ